MFTKRHYEKIGDTLRVLSKSILFDTDEMAVIIREFANTFEADNEKFDDIKFTKYVLGENQE